MPVDSYKLLPKSFRPMFENIQIDLDGTVWASFDKPLAYDLISIKAKEPDEPYGRSWPIVRIDGYGFDPLG